jgi:hypothetical protein
MKVATRRTVKRAIGLSLSALFVALVGCGSQTPTAQDVDETLSGIVSSDGAVDSTVTLTDASDPAQRRTASVDDAGAFSFHVAGLTAPYLLEARSTRDGQTVRLASFAVGAGWANISPITDAAVTATSDEAAAGGTEGDVMRRRAKRFETIVALLQAELKPLLDAYEVPADAFSARAPNPSLRSMLEDVRFEVAMGNVVVRNRASGGVIFTGPLSDLASGSFDAGSIPGVAAGGGTPPPALSGDALYAAKCSGCHGPLATSTRRGRTAAQITAMHGSMVTAAEAEAIAGALAVAPAPTPATCSSFTYSGWGACQPGNTQTRTVTASSPAGCTGGAPVLSQSCTYVPPTTTCTSFTYSAWGACQSNDTQTRTVTASSPAGCGGGSPVLSQSCTYVPPPPPTTSCTTCHGIPPATGKHARHETKASCATCHGSGYSTTAANAATHPNDVKNLTTTIGWNATSRTCANSCHGSKAW